LEKNPNTWWDAPSSYNPGAPGWFALLPVARSSVLAAAVELAALKQSSPKNAANTEPLTARPDWLQYKPPRHPSHCGVRSLGHLIK